MYIYIYITKHTPISHPHGWVYYQFSEDWQFYNRTVLYYNLVVQPFVIKGPTSNYGFISGQTLILLTPSSHLRVGSIVTALCGRAQGPISLTIFHSKIQIQCRFYFTVWHVLVVISQNIFAQAMTTWLSCHVQNFVMIALSELGWQEAECSIKFELQLKKC